MKDYKLIVKDNWRAFEKLAFFAIRAELKDYNIVKETLTEAIKDGGFDGEYILSVENNILQILFEAKLRSDVCADLELGQFAKSLVIAITRFANTIYIVTNLHFSEYTLEQLTEFSLRSEIEVKLYNGYSVKQFVENNWGELPQNIDKDLLDFLLLANKVTSVQSINTKQILTTSKVTFSAEEENQFNTIDKILSNSQRLFYIVGEPYVGKTFFINRLIQYWKQSYINAHIIDISKCLSYKDFFVELLEKTFGISFDLIDLLDNKNFEEAFQKIGMQNVSPEDLHILKIIFSKETTPKRDISLIFHFLCKFYTKLFNGRQGKNKFIIAFLNISHADPDIVRLIAMLLNYCQKLHCILEISENEYRLNNNEIWELETKKRLFDLYANNSNTLKIEEYKLSESIGILKEKYPELTREQCKNILRKFGYFKRELYPLIEVIELSNTPSEMLYDKIIRWEIQKEDSKITKCLCELNFKNNYISYIYIFLSCMGGKVSFDFLAGFSLIKHVLENCYLILKSTNLFHVTSRYIYVNNQKILNCINYYCMHKVSYTATKKVAMYVYNNLYTLHLSTEGLLETQVNCLRYIDKNERIRVNKLIELGYLYLALDQKHIANKKFNMALSYAEEEGIDLNSEESIRLYIGLIRACIWKAEKCKKNIENWLSEVSNSFLLISILSDEILQYKLDYFLLGYQLYHSIGVPSKALEYSLKGVDLIEEYNLYKSDIQKCGKMWRFHAIAVKEKYQDLKLCMYIFDKAKSKCQCCAQFVFGYVIHENMTFNDADYRIRLKKKLINYESLEKLEDKLSIDEYLHYKTNVAAIYFYLKKYDAASDIYSKLLDKSVTFGIKRETMRILNDMANIDWIHGNLSIAEIRYKEAIEIAKNAGYYHNCWPIYLNYLSYLIENENFIEAYKLYTDIKKYNPIIMKKCESDSFNYEERETYNTAFLIEIHCLCRLYNALKYSDLKDDISNMDIEKQVLFDGAIIRFEHLIQQLENTMYEHYTLSGKKLYLLKN